MNNAALSAALSVILGITLAAAAAPKLRRPKSFLLRVLEYRILPEAAARLYALLVPALELYAALLLFGGVAPRVAALLAAALLGTFIIGIVVNLLRGNRIDCGCFGAGRRRTIGWPLVGQDILLLAAALDLAAVSHGWISLQPWSVFAAGPVPLRGGVAALLLCALPPIAAIGARQRNRVSGRASLREKAVRLSGEAQ